MYYMKSQVNINWFIFNLIHLNRYICRILLHIFILINSTFISTGWHYITMNDDIRLIYIKLEDIYIIETDS